MTIILIKSVLLSGFLSSGNSAEKPPSDSTEYFSPAIKTIDMLFSSLKKERDAFKARSIANQIVFESNDSGSATINLLMQWASESSDKKHKKAAYDFLDQVVLLDPEYAQAPYRRALLYFSDGNTGKAIADINLALTKDPRFFPAFASLANILEASGCDKLALEAWERYLALYPADKEARKEAADLMEKLASTRS